MTMRVGINGFGRIGMLTTKALMRIGDIEVVAVNDVMPMESLSLLFERDSTHGIWHEDVSFDGSILRTGEREIKTFSEREPSLIPWGDVGVDVVVESSGKFTSREAAAGHLEGGAKKVIVSAPAKGADATFIYKVNHESYDPERHQVSPTQAAPPTASCRWPRCCRTTSGSNRAI
jgi:glyceraldehyde 3-phosphate dehydrogenase